MGIKSILGGALMQTKKVVFISDSLEQAHRFQKVLSEMDVETQGGPSTQTKTVLSHNPDVDLVIFEVSRTSVSFLDYIVSRLSEDGHAGLLVIADEEELAHLRLPVQVKSDFVMNDASAAERALRVRQLLWPGNEATSADMVRVGAMTINLATYQVKVNDEPLDLTYLEYALLAFLATHPGRTYSRDALLRRVWGFDYYGGSRTVDVHVRRVRAKLGPELANRLETVRGVGYLWNA